MENQIEVKIGNKKLVAYINDWEDELPKEIFISILDEQNRCSQDICMVREHYHYDRDTFDCIIDPNLIDCRVWADSGNEDYTHEFTIGIYKDEEDE